MYVREASLSRAPTIQLDVAEGEECHNEGAEHSNLHAGLECGV